MNSRAHAFEKRKKMYYGNKCKYLMSAEREILCIASHLPYRPSMFQMTEYCRMKSHVKCPLSAEADERKAESVMPVSPDCHIPVTSGW